MKHLFITAFASGLLLLGQGCIPPEQWYLLLPEDNLATTTPDSNSNSSTTSTKPTVCTMEYLPVCGFVPVTCVRAPCYPQPHTFSNRCMANAGGAVLIIPGPCAENQTYPSSTPFDK